MEITIEDLTKYRRTIIVFKALSGLAADYISNMFKFVNKVHSRNTRAALSEKLCIPKTRTQTYNNTLRCSGVRIWIDLTQPVRQSTSINHFKSNYFKFRSTKIIAFMIVFNCSQIIFPSCKYSYYLFLGLDNAMSFYLCGNHRFQS